MDRRVLVKRPMSPELTINNRRHTSSESGVSALRPRRPRTHVGSIRTKLFEVVERKILTLSGHYLREAVAE
jgi:hypothetical protein